VYKGSQYVPSLKSLSLSSQIFKLAPYSLEPLGTYKFIVDVRFFGDISKSLLSSSSTSAVVNVEQSGILASIAGGFYQSISISTLGLSLDARSSRNLDFPSSSPGSRASLSFSWECTELSPNFGASCKDFVLLPEAYIILKAENGEPFVPLYPVCYYESQLFL
jgi:hypothetical protein